MISIKNVILPNKPLNNFELEDAVKKLKIPIKLVDLVRIGSLGIKTVKLKSTSIGTVYALR